MAVYVDDSNRPYRGMLMSHLMADTTEELLHMVDKIGVQKKWIQNSGTWKEHFDVCKEKKELAIKNGAILLTERELSLMRAKRKNL